MQEIMDTKIYATAIDDINDLDNEIYIIRQVMTRLEKDVEFRKLNTELHARCIVKFNDIFKHLLRRRTTITPNITRAVQSLPIAAPLR